jgi:hypothetical protein
VDAFVAVYLTVGFLFVLALFGWLAVSAIRRHGLRNAARRAARTYAEELPLHWRVPVAAWTFLIALPLIAAWEVVTGNWDPVGASFLALLWLLYFGLLRWHWAAKRRVREPNPSSPGRVTSPNAGACKGHPR